MMPEEHPFADDGAKPKAVATYDIPFFNEKKDPIMALQEYRNNVSVKKKKITPKQREQETFDVIGKSLANVVKTEQLFSSGKKQVIFGTVPSKSNCYKIIAIKGKDPMKDGYASLAKTDKLAKYEKDFFIQCNVYRNKDLQGYLQIEVDVYYPNQRSDLDNSLKVILDCLQKVKAFDNDNKIVDIRIRKFLDKLNPRVEFSLKEAMS